MKEQNEETDMNGLINFSGSQSKSLGIQAV